MNGFDYFPAPPEGGGGGSPFDDRAGSSGAMIIGIQSITICADQYVTSIQTTYLLSDGTTLPFPRRGGGDGKTSCEVITLNQGDEIITIEGRRDKYVDQLSFTIRAPDYTERRYGPYGGDGGRKFVIRGIVKGFYGRYGDVLDQLGVYLAHPTSSLFGGREGYGFADAVFTSYLPIESLDSVTIYSDDNAVYAIVSNYNYTNGMKSGGAKYGGTNGDPHLVQLDAAKGERIIKVEGRSSDIVYQLTFTIQDNEGNLRTCGPYGGNGGSSFNAVNGHILGFFGRADDYLNAIGFYLEAPALDPQMWMQQIGPRIGHLTPGEIVIPATHNSGSFASTLICVRNQWENIQAQLNGGVRGFDIRVTQIQDPPPVLMMHHSGFLGPGQEFVTALQQIKAFVQEHPGEIIVMWLRPGAGSNLNNDQGKSLIRTAVLQELQEYLAPDKMKASAIQEFVEQHKNIIVVSEVGNESGFFWERDLFHNTWDARQSSPNYSVEQKIEFMREAVEANLEAKSTLFLWSDLEVWDTNILSTAGGVINPTAANWLEEWARQPNLRSGLNLISVDNVHAQDYLIVRTILGLYQTDFLPAPPIDANTRIARSTPGTPYDTVDPVDQGFDLAITRQLISDHGLDWNNLKNEYQSQGQLNSDTLERLADVGITAEAVKVFADWYENNASSN